MVDTVRDGADTTAILSTAYSANDAEPSSDDGANFSVEFVLKRTAVFVDRSVALGTNLIHQLCEGAEVFILDDQTDGILQIAFDLRAALQNRQFDSIHIVSHGRPGEVLLGNAVLDTRAISTHETALISIGRCLTSGADILVYGCNVAKGPKGRAFVEQLAELTGANVAASENPTGSKLVGGDANLQVTFGDVSTDALFDQKTLDSLNIILAFPPSNITPGSGTWFWTSPSGNFNYTDSISPAGNIDYFRFVTNHSSANGNSYTITVSGAVDSELRIYDSSGASITSIIDSASAGGTESITLNLTTGLWYYIAVSGYNSSTGSYTLGVNGPDAFINPLATPGPNYVSSSTGSISPGGDIDYFQVDAPAGTTSLNVSVTPASGVNTYVQVLNAAGTPLLGSLINNGGAGVTDFANNISISAGATYYVGVAALESGSYTIDVDFNPNVVGQINAIRWEDAAGNQLVDGATLNVGDTIYIEVDTQNMRGTTATVYLYEDDAGITFSELINSISIPIATTSDTGRIAWTVPWSADGDGADIFPEYRLWRSQNTFETLSSRLLNVREITPPSTPGTPDLSSADDSGYSSSDNTTNRTSGLTFSWSASSDSQSGLNGYQYRIDGGAWSSVIGGTAVDISAAHGSHTFGVRAVDNSGNLSGESSLGFTVDTQAPGLPTLLSPANGAQLTDTTPFLDWSDASGAYRYNLKYETSLPFDEITVTDLSASSYQIPNALDNNITYYWRVEAADLAGNASGYTSDNTFSIPAIPPQINAIRWEDAAGNQLVDGATLNVGDTIYIEIDTQGMRGTSGTVYLYEDDAGITFSELINSINISIPATSDTGRIAWTVPWNADSDGADIFPEYRLWRSQNTFETLSSRLLNVREITPPSIPGTPDLSSADDSGYSSSDNTTNRTSGLTFSWSASSDSQSGLNGYQYRIDGGAWSSVIGGTSVDISAAHGSHTFGVRAVDNNGNVSGENSLSFTVDTQAPGLPTLLSPANGAQLTDTTPFLDWSDVSGAYRYNLKYETSLPFDEITVTDLGASSYQIPNALDNNITYYWRVEAADLAGNASGYTSDSTFSIPAAVTTLSFRSGSSLSSPTIDDIRAGQTVYVRADAPGMEGQTINVQIYEDDGIGDDHVASLSILIGSQGFGVATWTPTWQSDDGGAPFNRYYAYYDVPLSLTDIYSGSPNTGHFLVKPPLDDALTGGAWGSTADQPFPEMTPVTLSRIDSSAPIDPSKETWIVIHGLNSSFQHVSPNPQWNLAEAVAAASGDDQVLTLDWSAGAAFHIPFLLHGEMFIEAVANWTAQVLIDYGFANSSINLIGHSWGGVMTAEIAEAMHGVDRLIALDPAEDAFPVPPVWGTLYDTDDVDFAANSNFSWAFLSSWYGSGESAPRADATFMVDIDGVAWFEDLDFSLFEAHTDIVPLFTTMLNRNANGTAGSVSQLFELSDVNGNHVWANNTIDGNAVTGGHSRNSGSYEGVLYAQKTSGDVLIPVSFEYRDIFGNYQNVPESTSAPEIAVSFNGTNIVDGDPSPSSAEGTDFGSVVQGAVVDHVFRVNNTGTAPLTTSGLTPPTGFTVVEPLSSSIPVGGFDDFTVRLDTSSTGTKSGQISFTDNDSNESPFDFEISGTVNATPVPEIAVSFNGTNIVDGDPSPSSAEGTDFGSVVQGAAVDRVFRVNNTGTAPLTTSGLTPPTGFTVVEPLSSTIPIGGFDDFTVRLDTSSIGTKTGQISFNNNDSNESPFNFEISGTVTTTPVPEIAVSFNGTNIVDGDPSPSSAEGTDFGSVVQGAVVDHVFRVNNTGTAPLTTSGLTPPPGFTVVEPLSSSIPVGGFDDFTVRLDTSSTGTKSGQISFTDNDSNESPFNFEISGTVTTTPVPEIAVSFNGTNIVDGDPSPSSAEGTDFGSVVQGAVVDHVFRVNNTGTAPLTTSGLTPPPGFTVVGPLSSSIPVGGFDDFTVRLDTSSTGTKSGQISFTDNDSNESPFDFEISGTVNAPPPPTISVADTSVEEGGVLRFRVFIESGQPFNQNVAISYATQNGTAESDDFVPASGAITILRGNLEAFVDVTTIDDYAQPTAGFDDILELHISAGANAIIGDGIALGEIRDDGDKYWQGDAGNNEFNWRAGAGEDFYDGDAGIDTLNYASTKLGIVVDLSGGIDTSGPEIGNDFLIDIENVIGGSGNDRIVGNAFANHIDGGPGLDTAVFSGPRSAYTLIRINGLTLQVSGPDGTDTLTKIEKLSFDDGTIPSGLGLVPNDFTADGKAEVLWQHKNGAPAIWSMNDTAFAGGTLLLNPGPTWHAKAAADFTGDGKADILWQNDSGLPAIWTMDGTTMVSGALLLNPGPGWHAVAAADFSGDGKADILWQNDNGTPAVWLMDGPTMTSAALLVNPGASWHAKAAADFTGDGKADILWQNDNGTPAIWTMDGTTMTGAALLLNPGPSWHVEAAADFTGDGKADILWQNDNGTPAIWTMDGTTMTAGALLFNPGPSWHIDEAVDVTGDGKADILWQNDSGLPAIWQMDGMTMASAALLPNPSPEWHLI